MYTIKADIIREGFSNDFCWVHARVGLSENDSSRFVLTAQQLWLGGNDVFRTLHSMYSEDFGKSWTPIKYQQGFEFKSLSSGSVLGVSDFVPKLHEKSNCLLGIGHTVEYLDNKLVTPRKRETAYSVYSLTDDKWCDWKVIKMPDEERFRNAGAGCSQRYDLVDGDILIPFYYEARQLPTDGGGKRTVMSSAVMKLGFDGNNLTFKECGNEMSKDSEARGICEPSLTKFGDLYYITLRADSLGYVSISKDGLNFEEPKCWRWDNGDVIPTYNTQQHWVTHSRGLFLVYTRKNGTNDHVFRHRAPLYIAQVDPKNLCLMKETEKILIPERGARLGNFGVVDVSPTETWITVNEWMQPIGCEKYGSNNAFYLARIIWDKPNLLF